MPSLDWKSRFWKKVDKENGPVVNAELGRCWLWIASVDKDGYGEFGSLQGPCYKETRETRAHRISFAINNGLSAYKKLVLHKCDVSGCVNPAHLYLGDHADNAQEREARRRRLKPNDYKVSLGQAQEMKDLYASGLYSYPQLGKMFFISTSQAYYIINNPKWGSGLLRCTKNRVVVPKRVATIHKLTLEQKNEVRRLYATGQFTHKQLSLRFGASESHILNMIHNRW